MGLPAAVDGENEVYEVTVHPEAVGGDGPPVVPCKTEIFRKVYDPKKGQARWVLIGVIWGPGHIGPGDMSNPPFEIANVPRDRDLFIRDFDLSGEDIVPPGGLGTYAESFPATRISLEEGSNNVAATTAVSTAPLSVGEMMETSFPPMVTGVLTDVECPAESLIVGLMVNEEFPKMVHAYIAPLDTGDGYGVSAFGIFDASRTINIDLSNPDDVLVMLGLHMGANTIAMIVETEDDSIYLDSVDIHSINVEDEDEDEDADEDADNYFPRILRTKPRYLR